MNPADVYNQIKFFTLEELQSIKTAINAQIALIKAQKINDEFNTKISEEKAQTRS